METLSIEKLTPIGAELRRVMCYERLSLGCEMSPESFFDETALNLLRDIGVVVQLDETEYEFTPGFDPELGEWT